MIADGGGEVAERRELRAEGPTDPLAELAASDVDLFAVEDCGERFESHPSRSRTIAIKLSAPLRPSTGCVATNTRTLGGRFGIRAAP